MEKAALAKAEALGTVIGAGGGILALLVVAVLLLASGGADWRVLIAPWLWTLPVIGLGAGIGRTAAMVIARTRAGQTGSK